MNPALANEPGRGWAENLLFICTFPAGKIAFSQQARDRAFFTAPVKKARAVSWFRLFYSSESDN